MQNCKSCFTPLDQRSAVSCVACSGLLHVDCRIKEGDKSYCDSCYTMKDKKKPYTRSAFIMPESIRRSDIETYIKCPYQFMLKQLIENQGESEGTIHTRLGIDLHNLYYIHALHGMKKEDMIEALRLCWQEYPAHFFRDTSRELMELRATTCIDNFYKFQLPTTAFALEEKLYFKIADDMPTVNITMDRIDEVDGMLELTDWKTGRVMSGKKFTTDLQPPLYIHAVQQHYGKPVRKFTLVYLNEDKVRVYERVTDDEFVCRVKKNEYRISIREALGRVNKVFSLIKNGHFSIPVDARSMFFTCKICEFKANGKCRGAEEQSWWQVKESREA